MTSGSFWVHRGIFESTHFDPEPFTQREAFIWMLGMASWRPTTVRYKQRRIELRRGQFSVSVRDMATAFSWHRARVGRFLKRLKTETVIETDTETGVLIITICNYNKYQGEHLKGETPGETPGETRPRQERDTEQEREEREEGKKEGRPKGLSIKPTFDDEFSRFWNACIRKVGKGAAQKAFAKATKADPPDVIIAAMAAHSERWRRDSTDPQYIPHPATWLNQGRWNDELDDPNAGLGWAARSLGEQFAERHRDDGPVADDGAGEPLDASDARGGNPAHLRLVGR